MYFSKQTYYTIFSSVSDFFVVVVSRVFFFCFCFCLLVSQLSSGCKCSRLKICCILAFIDFLLLLQLPRDTQSKLCRLLMGLQCLLFFLYVYLFVLNSYGNFDFFYICFFFVLFSFRLLICYFVVAYKIFHIQKKYYDIECKSASVMCQFTLAVKSAD